MQIDADGSFSDGFSTNVLPHASAGAHIHIGHHRREVERRDAGDDAERLADRVDVDAGRRLLGEARPSAACGIPQANSITSSPRATSPSASERTLPCSAVRIRAISSPALVRGARGSRKKSSARLRERHRAPGGEGGLRGRDRGVDLLGRREVDLAGLLPERGVEDRARCGRTLPATGLPPIQWLMRVTSCFCSVGGVASSVMSCLLESVAEKGSARYGHGRRACRARPRSAASSSRGTRSSVTSISPATA